MALFRPTEAAVAHSVGWGSETKLPIVDGKIEHPLTRAVQPRGATCMNGPPAIDLIWWSKTPTPTSKGFRGSSFLDVDKLFANIATLFQRSDMRLVTTTASLYHVFILCEMSKSMIDHVRNVSMGSPESVE
jgi:hypothetical protein